MKALILACFVLFGTGFAMSQKYAYIDSDYILSKMPEYTEAKEQLDKLADRWTKEIEKLYEVLTMKKEAFAREEVLLPAEEEREGYDWLFEADELELRDLKKTKIAGSDFVWSETLIIQEDDTSYINDYVGIKDKYFLVITTTVNSPGDKLVEQNFLQNIKKLK